MAGQLGTGGSRTGSLSLEGVPLMANSTSEQDQLDEGSLATLARRNTMRNRSLRNKKMMELQDVMAGSRRPSEDSIVDQQHLHPTTYNSSHRRSPSLRRGNSPTLQRSPSPRKRYMQHDIGFSDTVSNVVEIVKHDHHRGYSSGGRHRIRNSWSASTSPARSPSPTHNMHTSRSGNSGHGPMRTNRAYGTTSLCQRSRSPSPTPHSNPKGPPTIACAVVGLNPPTVVQLPPAADPVNVQRSYPVLGGRRGQGRRLPPTPCKPSTLQLRPANINFPKLNASPTHIQTHSAHNTPHNLPQHGMGFHRDHVGVGVGGRETNMPSLHQDVMSPPHQHAVAAPNIAPLSFEQAVAMGRGGRMLPSPVPNGYKPKPPNRSRHSDSDDDDWC